MPAPPNAGQGADNHDSEDKDERDPRGVGPAAHQAKQSGLAGEHPLPEGVIVFAGTRLKLNTKRFMPDCRHQSLNDFLHLSF